MKKELRGYQKIAIETLTRNNKGLLVSPTGSGKSLMMLGLYEKIKPSSCLVIVPTSALEAQMKNTFSEYEVCVSTWQSVHASHKSRKNDEGRPVHCKDYEMVLADESHHVSEETIYGDIIKEINPKYFYAVTATQYRQDGIRELEYICDNHKHVIPIEILYNGGYLVRPSVKFVSTNFHYDVNNILTNFERQNFSFEQKLGRLKSHIGTDSDRNKFLINYISQGSFNCALVLSYTTEQTERLYEAYCPKNMFEQKHLIHGKLGVKAKRAFFETIDKQTQFIIFATMSFLGEGFDLPKLDTLFLCTPFGGGAKTIQFAGRVLRIFPGKTFVNIYDFVDDFGELGAQWASSRRKRYDLLIPKYEELEVDKSVVTLAALRKELAEAQRDFEIKYNWLEVQAKEVQDQYTDAMLAINHKIRGLCRKIALHNFTK